MQDTLTPVRGPILKRLTLALERLTSLTRCNHRIFMCHITDHVVAPGDLEARSIGAIMNDGIDNLQHNVRACEGLRKYVIDF